MSIPLARNSGYSESFKTSLFVSTSAGEQHQAIYGDSVQSPTMQSDPLRGLLEYAALTVEVLHLFVGPRIRDLKSLTYLVVV